MNGEFILRLPLSSSESDVNRITLPLKSQPIARLEDLSSSSDEGAGDESVDEDREDENEQDANSPNTILTISRSGSSIQTSSAIALDVEKELEMDEEGDFSGDDVAQKQPVANASVEEDVSGLRRSGRKRTTRLDPEFELSFSGETDADSDDSSRKTKRRKRGKKAKQAPISGDFKITLEKPKHILGKIDKAEASNGFVGNNSSKQTSGSKLTSKAVRASSKKVATPSSGVAATQETDTGEVSQKVGRKKLSIRQRLAKKLGPKFLNKGF